MPSTGFSILRLLAVAATLLVSVSVADAYTLVLRGGRRIEVPNTFVVSGLTLTYEAGAGIQVSVQLASIDISATERANNDVPGSFSKRATPLPANRLANSDQQIPTNAHRSITNTDLEIYRNTRLESERAYEQRRRELGLPSREEMRQKAVADTAQTRDQLLKERSREQLEENYWRSRATQLRTEIEATDAQIRFLENRVNTMPNIASLGAFGTVFPFSAVVSSRVSPGLNSTFVPGPHIIPQAVPLNSRQFGGPVGPGRGRVGGGTVFNPNPSHGGRGGRVLSGFPIVAAPLWSSDYGYDRTALITQLDQLRLQRAKLQSMWQNLEDEARRAGAYPGWLRP